MQASKNYAWASSGCSILSEIGTMHLEFSYLSDITGNSTFRDKVQKVRTVLKNMEKPKGLYPNYIHPKTGKWGQRKYQQKYKFLFSNKNLINRYIFSNFFFYYSLVNRDLCLKYFTRN